MRVFLSVGSCFRPSQETFLGGLETLMRERGLEPRTIGRNVFSDTQPLKAVHLEMKKCRGAVIIAFERIRIQAAVEKDATELRDVSITTPWNHIEASMAYTLGLPMLVLKERQVKAEGMLEKYDWYVQEFDSGSDLLSQAEFLGRFDAWRGRLRRWGPL